MFNTLEKGVGMTVCPDSLVGPAIGEGRFVRIPWAAAPEETTLFLIRHADKWCSPATSRFIEITKEVVASTNP